MCATVGEAGILPGGCGLPRRRNEACRVSIRPMGWRVCRCSGSSSKQQQLQQQHTCRAAARQPSCGLFGCVWFGWFRPFRGRGVDVRVYVGIHVLCVGADNMLCAALILPATATAHRVCVIGAGVAGLRAAQALSAAGAKVTVFDRGDGVGGVVQTDCCEGFRLDRGFQVFLTAYPESKACLDYTELELCEFIPGAAVQLGSGGGSRHVVADPSRYPAALLRTLRFPVGSALDKIRLVIAVLALRLLPLSTLFAEYRPRSALEYLRDDVGMSTADGGLIASFFRPFFKGIFLSKLEQQDAVLLRFVLKMFAEGAAALPAHGLGAVSEQLAQSVRDMGGTIRLSCAVEELRAADSGDEGGVREHEVLLADGSCLAFDHIILATPRSEARRILRGVAPRALAGTGWLDDQSAEETRRMPLSSACVYFALDHTPPVSEPMLVLNGASGVVNTCCFPSVVSAAYAPPGQHLASVAVVDADAVARADLEAAVRAELSDWFGAAEVRSWRHLRTYRIQEAQEARPPPNAPGFNRSPRVSTGLYVCGAHCATPSLNGALLSGRVAAEALLEDTRARTVELVPARDSL